MVKQEGRMAMVEDRGISTVGEREDLGLGDVVDEREDLGLGLGGLYHLLKSDRLEVMDRRQSARPEVVEKRKPREEKEEKVERTENSARHSLKSQVITESPVAILIIISRCPSHPTVSTWLGRTVSCWTAQQASWRWPTVAPRSTTSSPTWMAATVFWRQNSDSGM